MRCLSVRSVSVLLAGALLVCLLLYPTSAVDRKKFRTCQDTAFCKRNRAVAADGHRGPQRFFITSESVRVDNGRGRFTSSLAHSVHPLQPHLSLTVSVLQSGIVHIQAKEPQPLHPRWVVQDVVEPSATSSPHPSVHFDTTATRTTARWSQPAGNDSNTVVQCELNIAYRPLQISLSVNGQPSVIFNQRGLINYEQYRDKNPMPAPAADQPTDPNNSAATPAAATAPPTDPASMAYPYDDAGMWDESFGGHSDSKRYGPASVAADFSFPRSRHVYGIPEHASSFSLRSTYGAQSGDYNEPFRLYNLDVFEYELNEPMSLYGAVPFLIAHHSSATTGVLWLNSAETFIDVSDSSTGGGLLSSGTPQKDTHWMSESGVIDAYLLPGPTPTALFTQYALLTGPPALPRYFAIGYHQCRWNYKSEDDVKAVDAGFDEHDIPYDVIWLDIEHTDGKSTQAPHTHGPAACQPIGHHTAPKYFTWDAHNFPHPADMQQHVASHGREMVTIVDPHMKRDSGYSVHTTALEKGYYVKTASDGVYEGWCWPGSVSYLDFLDPIVRQYWADQFALDKYAGSTPHLFTWNDMNEPSVFNGPEVTMPKDCRHLHSSVEHRDVHNVYGHYNHMSTAQGLKQRDSKRPFVLTRSFYAGSQRYSAVWTGDNAADWSHLAIATPMLLSLNVAGITFSGADVGGFFKDPDAELLTRWYQTAAYQPFFRGHAHIETKRREPWLFGEPYTGHIKAAIKARYTLLPYIYTLFYQAATTGVPVMRPLWADFPQDESTFAIDSEFLLGSSLLIVPVSSAGAQSVSVYLPAGVWYEHQSLQAVQAGQHTVLVTLSSIPVYYRGGSVVVRKDRARRSSRLMAFDPFTVVVAADVSLSARGRLYVDDGESFEWQQGQFAYREIELVGGKELRATRVKGSAGVLRSEAAVERIVLLGLPHVSSATVIVGGGQQRRLEASRAKDGSFVIRKPDLLATDNWTITLQ